MARHRASRRTLLSTVAAAGLTTVLALGPSVDAATAAPRDIVVGVGGANNPTSDRVRDKFRGDLVGALEDDGYTFEGLRYPAALPLGPSIRDGVPKLHAVIDSAAGGRVVVVGYSEGALVAEQVRRDLARDPHRPPTDRIEFALIGSPFVPNGGIYARFPDLRIPGLTNMGPTQPSPYATTFYSMEYDLVADFPAYGNPLTFANAVVGFLYFHGDHGPDAVDLDTHPTSVLVVDNAAGGTDTYVLIRARHLPLLQPIRDIAAATGSTVLTEPVLGAIEPTLRLLVDMGYTDRHYRTIGSDDDPAYQHADEPTRFSLATPHDRIRETMAALPEALRDGAENFVDAITPPARKVKKPAEGTDDDALTDDREAESDATSRRTPKPGKDEESEPISEDQDEVAGDEGSTDTDTDVSAGTSEADAPAAA
ncbi:PE-PPE domain-containing protein [Mycobacterium sp. PS03-16]|uniref:PE-PPE domain-containing protein n=1 Tax=Mycobacterium sp. PS03-16 TaxID=2559611 RepID=UPI00107445BE|nr:PE-PPE domain-containing protein [Mycobacterium sp. PS03-16]TFV56691.1 PE-PPE domain-containing protein [Mycobacterium sp. PS03-16]